MVNHVDKVGATSTLGASSRGRWDPWAAQGQPDRNPAGQEGWGGRGGGRAAGRAIRRGSGEPGPRPSPEDPSHHSEHRGASGPPPASPLSLPLAVPCPLAALSGAQFPRGARGPGDVEWWGQDSDQLPARRHTGQLPGLADSRAGGPAGARQRAAHHVSQLGGGGHAAPGVRGLGRGLRGAALQRTLLCFQRGRLHRDHRGTGQGVHHVLLELRGCEPGAGSAGLAGQRL